MGESKADTAQAPGLKWFKRTAGKVPYWVADEACVRDGYPVKTANLAELAGSPAALIQRCHRLQAEMLAWKQTRIASAAGGVPSFNGTFGALIDIYERDPESPFNVKLKPRAVKTYTVYLRRLRRTIGDVLIDEADGRDLRRWFSVWADQEDPSNPRSPYRKLGAGQAAFYTLKSAISFGVFCRYQGCSAFQLVMRQITFPTLAARTHAPTREQMEAAGQAAIDAGSPSRALAYALQFETTVRQSDIIGEWVALSDPRPSTILAYGKKWIGPLWEQIDEQNIWRMTHGKTECTSGARGVYDLSVCPMVMDHVRHIPVQHRKGPVIVNEATGLPYIYERYRYAWNKDYRAAGLPKGLWNRDTRAGGNTEAQIKGGTLEDRKKVMGHTKESTTTAQVYDRDVLEAHRRIAKVRNSG